MTENAAFVSNGSTGQKNEIRKGCSNSFLANRKNAPIASQKLIHKIVSRLCISSLQTKPSTAAQMRFLRFYENAGNLYRIYYLYQE